MSRIELKNQIDSQFRVKVRHQYDARLKKQTDKKELKQLLNQLIESNSALIAINERLDNTVINVKDLAREVVKEVLNPLSTGNKFTRAEQIKVDAAAKTASDNLKLIQKNARKRK